MLSWGRWSAAGENVGCWEERKNGDWGGNGENLELWGEEAELCALGADDEEDSAVGVLQIERSTLMFIFLSSCSEAVAQVTSLNRIVVFFFFVLHTFIILLSAIAWFMIKTVLARVYQLIWAVCIGYIIPSINWKIQDTYQLYENDFKKHIQNLSVKNHSLWLYTRNTNFCFIILVFLKG